MPNWIDPGPISSGPAVLDYTSGVTQSGTMAHGSGGGEGKASFNDFSFQHKKALPAGEIHVDKYGRVKVQFFWDRTGQKDDSHSRCMWCPR
jgi:hypothetical protein